MKYFYVGNTQVENNLIQQILNIYIYIYLLNFERIFRLIIMIISYYGNYFEKFYAEQ